MTIITLSEAAAQKANELRAKSDSPEDRLRVRVVDGGCSGMRYELVFDSEQLPGDVEDLQHGVPVVVDPESAQYLAETHIDFVSTLNESGFKIENPNADTTCGCGESFGVGS